MARHRSLRRLPRSGVLLAVLIAAVGIGTGLFVSWRTSIPPASVTNRPQSEPSARLPLAPAPKALVPFPSGGSNPAAREGSRTGARHVRAQVAVIFDDAGGSLEDLEEILAIGRPVTVAVLPGLRYSKEVAGRARAAGLDVFLHLPIEPDDSSKRLGPGGITSAMNDEEIAAAVRADLATVPGAIGVNNHMGSSGTTDERVMRAVLQVVKEHGLIFVDSVTSDRSVAVSVAEEMGIPTGRRHVFLDNADEPAAIRAQLRRLIAVARRRGVAIGIGHAQRLTPAVLKEMLTEFDRQGIQLVPVSVLLK